MSLGAEVTHAIEVLRSCISCFGFFVGSLKEEDADLCWKLPEMLCNLSLTDMNHILFRCEEEEKDLGKNGGVYVIPKFGSLTYCGLQGMRGICCTFYLLFAYIILKLHFIGILGIITLLKDIHLKNDLGHPFCENLRQGNWLPTYVANRLKSYPTTSEVFS